MSTTTTTTTTTTIKPAPSLPHLLPTFQILAVLPCTLKLFYITYSYFSAGPYNPMFYLTYVSPYTPPLLFQSGHDAYARHRYWCPPLFSSFAILYLASKHPITLQSELAKSVLVTWVYLCVNPLWWNLNVDRFVMTGLVLM
jgi:hypothetical protein